MATRTHAGVALAAEELLEPTAIALNLIDVGYETAR
jgi:hypothetical protein